jgi:hypothetical protein
MGAHNRSVAAAGLCSTVKAMGGIDAAAGRALQLNGYVP